MTPESIRALCKKNDLYMKPSLNEVLYLHFQGFSEIAGLEEYTKLKCLWLDSNAIGRIQGLDKQADLKCLFLQNNLIRVSYPLAPRRTHKSPDLIPICSASCTRKLRTCPTAHNWTR